MSAATDHGPARRAGPSVVGRALILALAVLWTLPVTGMALSGLRPAERGATSGWWTAVTAPELTVENLQAVLQEGGAAPGMWESLLASLGVALPATLFLVALAAPLAYTIAWSDLAGRRLLHMGAVALLFVPVQVTLVPLVAVYDDLGLRGSWPGLWLAHVAFGLPLAVVLLAGAMREVPEHLLDAARTDGAGHLAILLRVVAPLVVPALAGVAVLQFLLTWNDFVVAAALLGGPDPGTAPLPLALAELVRSRPSELHLLGAAGLITVVVPLAVYAATSRLVVGATAAATIREQI